MALTAPPKDKTGRGPASRAKIIRVAAVLSTFLVFLGTYVFFDRLEPRAKWLEVEGPKRAVIGEPLELRITHGALPQPLKLGCNLNWSRKNRDRAGMLASGSPYPTVQEAGTTVVRFPVREKEEMAFVSAIIYLTPTGDWRDSIRVAYTELIPVQRAGPETREILWKKLKVYPSVSPAEAGLGVGESRETKQDTGIRFLQPSDRQKILAALLFASAVISALNSALGRRAGEDPKDRRDSKIWLGLATVLAAAVLVEITGILPALTGWGRRIAGDWGVYYFRRSFQKPLAAGLTALGTLILVCFLKRWKKIQVDWPLWSTGLGLAVYLLATLASILSYHPLDALRGFSFLGISLVSLAKASGAAVAFGGALAGAIRAKARPSG